MTKRFNNNDRTPVMEQAQQRLECCKFDEFRQEVDEFYTLLQDGVLMEHITMKGDFFETEDLYLSLEDIDY